MRFAAFSLLALMFISACSFFVYEEIKPESQLVSPPPPVSEPEVTETLEPVIESPNHIGVKKLVENGDAPLSSIMKFDKFTSLRYRLVLYESGFPDLHYVNATVSRDTFQGRAAWRIVSSWSTNNIIRREVLIVDEQSLLCLARNGTVGEQVQSGCPALGPFGTERKNAYVHFFGSEDVFGFNGTQSSLRYGADGTIYYTDPFVPFPLKITVLNGTLVVRQYELDGYS